MRIRWISGPEVLVLALALTLARPAGVAADLSDRAKQERGRILAQAYCTTCHALPVASHLPRSTWQRELLPKMRFVTGLESPPPGYFHDEAVLRTNGFFPAKPLMTAEIFDAISAYYLSAAPESLPAVADETRVPVTLRQFRIEPSPVRRLPQLTTIVKWMADPGVIAVGDATFQGFDFLSGSGEKVSSLELGNIPVSIADTPKAYWVAAIGHFFPREEPRGQIVRFDKTPAGLRRATVLSDLPRTTDVQVADLNGDGREDMVVCSFGNMMGRFSWYESGANGTWKEHVLLDKPGALRSEVRDFNRDGHPDIAVLQAQWAETLWLFHGDGKGGFTRKTVMQHPPSWGHSGFESVDFNGDGHLDFLVTNGDNADFTTSPPKSHHGIRLYLHRSDGRYEDAWSYPLNGAYKAAARDFDGDGDLDVAAISFFPDYERAPREGFVYLQNQGGMKFSPSTFKESFAGRWLTMDVADLDQDGDDDVVLGSMVKVPVEIPAALKDLWEKKGPSVLILRNHGREMPGP